MSDIDQDTSFDDMPHRRKEDEIPSAYKYYFQKVLAHMDPPPKMIEAIRRAVVESNDLNWERMKSHIREQVNDHDLRSTADMKVMESKVTKIEMEMSVEVAKARTALKIMNIIIGIIMAILASSFVVTVNAKNPPVQSGSK